MSSVYCHWIEGVCYDYVGKCFTCKLRAKAIEEAKKEESST